MYTGSRAVYIGLARHTTTVTALQAILVGKLDLEPVEGQYRWQLIDEPLEAWAKREVRIAFRISIKLDSF